MKKRMKMLMTLFLAASMALTPITVMADDGQVQTQNAYETSEQEPDVDALLSDTGNSESEAGTSLQKREEEATANQAPSVGTTEENPATGSSSGVNEVQGISDSEEPGEISNNMQP